MSTHVRRLVKDAKSLSFLLGRLTTSQKNKALKNMAKVLLERKSFILSQNRKDIASALKKKLKKSFIDRLTLNDARLRQMSDSLRAVAALDDPVGNILSVNVRPNGMKVEKVRVPIGVILIVYEARPNVTSDCVGLLFKTSNFGILRGGADSLYSNRAIGKVLNEGLKKSGIDFPVFFVVQNPDRKTVDELLKEDEYIDLVIPRGGESLIRKVVETSHIPVITHHKGVCHIFVGATACIKEAVRICLNAKVQRPSVCNAVETILVDSRIASKFLPVLKKEFDACGVQIKGDAKTCSILSGLKKASVSDWSKEYLDLIVSMKVVNNTAQAIAHINLYGSKHTDSILTKDKAQAEKFIREVDSACCFVNISTRFSDGYEFGLGAEIGISTDKLHARGPMGLEELTSYKYVVRGTGQIRADLSLIKGKKV